MKWKNKFLLLLIVTVMAFPFFQNIETYADTIGDFQYVINADVTTVTITKYNGAATDIIIPNTIDGKSVTSIGEEAFLMKDCPSVIIPDSVTSIGEHAFHSNYLSSITIPQNVTSIGAFAFVSNNLTSITIPENVTRIGASAFTNNKLTSVIIKSKNTTIDTTAFVNQNLPDGKRTSYWYENPSCTGSQFNFSALRENNVTIYSYPQVVLAEDSLGTLNVNTSTVTGLTAGKEYKVIVDGVVKYAKTDGTISDNKGDIGALVGTEITGLEVGKTYKVEEYIAPAATLDVTIATGTASASTKATITGSATSKFVINITDNQVSSPTVEDEAPTSGDNFIDSYASGADITKGVEANKYLQVYDIGADNKVVKFYQKQLTADDIKVDPRILTDDEVEVTAGIIKKYTGTKTEIVIPSILDGQTVTGIGSAVFNAKNITSITIPDSVTTIGKCTFQYNHITSITIPDSVTSIGAATFEANNLTSIIIPDSVTSIEASAFWNNQLTSVTIPTSVTSIGGDAFANNQLTSVIIKSKNTTIDTTAFVNQTLPDNTKTDIWYENPSCTGLQFDFTAVRENNVTIYSYPQVVEYKVTFDTNGADTITPSAITLNSSIKISEPTTPEKTGYTFKGWYKESSLNNKWDFDSDVVTENIKLYAKWELEDTNASTGKKANSHHSRNNNIGEQLKTTKLEVKGDFIKKLNIDEISKNFGDDVNLEDINLQVETSKANEEQERILEDKAKKEGFKVIVKPLIFSVECSYKDQRVKVDKYSTYVEQTINIPDEVDGSKLTTVVVLEEDGSIRHIPTKITIKNEKCYAKINSLTNGVFALIYNPVEFKDLKGHWGKESINDLGSRMIVNGVDKSTFEPNRDITRAEFVTIVVRALGLKPEDGNSGFEDVKDNSWYNDYINTANKYKLISGYENGEFKPMDNITREQAMSIIARASSINGLESSLKDGDINILEQFEDYDKIAKWAEEDVNLLINNDIVLGREGHALTPKENITRAEIATITKRFLEKSNLI